MQDIQAQIADIIRGVASEKRATQERVASILGISRQAVNARFTGRLPFTATEIFTLASAFNVPISRFFPEPASERVSQ